MAFANKLELHYYFNDDSHSMDAFVRNKCEAELLALINEVKTQLGFDFHIDAEALNEGTLRERWKFVGENAPQIGIILSIIAIIISVSQLYESKQDEMDEELKRLSIEEKKLFIEKLKKELYEGQASNDSIKDSALSINNDLKVLTRKSNFYKALDNYEKVVAVSFNPLTIENKPIYPEKQILKSEFYKYILSTNEIPEEVIQNAEIEIVSPVLKEGRYKWKGIYQDEAISFSMNDSDFKNDVLSKRISFQHGAIIQCVLKIGRELDETGEIVRKGYTVQTVIAKVDGDVINETYQGKRYKYHKKFIEGQDELFKK